MQGIKCASHQHHSSHAPVVWQPLLPPRDPPSEPCQHRWVCQCGPAAEDAHAHPFDCLPQRLRIRHNQCHGPCQPLTNDTHLCHACIFSNHPLHLSRWHLDAAGQHNGVDKPACDSQLPIGVDLSTITGLNPLGHLGDFQRARRSGWSCVVAGLRLLGNDDANGSARRAHEQLTSCLWSQINFELHALKWRSNSTRPGISWIANRDNRPGLSQPVSLHQRHPSAAKGFGCALSQRRSTRHTHPNAAPHGHRQVGDRASLCCPLQTLKKSRYSQHNCRWHRPTSL